MPTKPNNERLEQIQDRIRRLRVENKRDLLLASTSIERAYENTIHDLLDDIDFLLFRLEEAEKVLEQQTADAARRLNTSHCSVINRRHGTPDHQVSLKVKQRRIK